MIHPDASSLTGGAPLVELSRLARGLGARVVGKLEMRNPAGSVKDRLGLALIEDAERRGRLRHGATLVEATGGNTGIGLAFVCAIRGHRLILAMPESLSVERVALLRQLGAEVVLTPGILMAEAAARRLARTEGIVAGVSSGAALHAALAIAARPEAAGATIVVLLADTGERYITTALFSTGGPA
jgi:cysteine synthase A